MGVPKNFTQYSILYIQAQIKKNNWDKLKNIYPIKTENSYCTLFLT